MLAPIDLLKQDYTDYNSERQIRLSLDYELRLPGDAEVRLLDAFVDRMDLSALYETYGKLCPDNKADASGLLKVFLYANSDIGSSPSVRALEEKCLYDDRYRFLLKGKPAPDHTTLSRFRSQHFRPCMKGLMAAHVKVLFELGEIDGSILFQDGTKILANANKYTFVWRGSVSKNLEKLALEMLSLIQTLEKAYGLQVRSKGNVIDMDSLDDFLKQLEEYQLINEVKFVQGTGHKKTDFQKDFEKYALFLVRIKKYLTDLDIMGDRNSYSKTDHESTFMRNKDDHMMNGQLVPAFNLQHTAQGGYVVWAMDVQMTNDMYTVIPMISEIKEWLPFLNLDIYCADAGYESEENYAFLKENNVKAYIKPSNFEKSKTKAFKNNIGLVENMKYNSEEDFYICAEGKELRFTGIKRKKTRGGRVSEISNYECSECDGCPRKKECIRGNHSSQSLEERSKKLSLSKSFKKMREESLERITSDLGKKIRMNRSIQIEGSFGNVKSNHNLTRYRTRGLENVLAESLLMVMALNIKKLHNRIQKKETGKGLYEAKEKKPEKKKTAAERQYTDIIDRALRRFDKEEADPEAGRQIELELAVETKEAQAVSSEEPSGSEASEKTQETKENEGTKEITEAKESNEYDEPTLRFAIAGDYNKSLVEERRNRKRRLRKKKAPARHTPHEDELDENLVGGDPAACPA